jgi:5'-3' exonuclease
MDVFPQYKANRTTDDSFMGGPFFAMAYGDDLFIEGGCTRILKYPRLEADDCIALATKHILETEPDSEVWIVASDADYLQLADSRVHIVDLKMKPINRTKKWSGDAQTDLFCKIVMGDSSDGIPGIVPKCGIKTAMKYHANPALFEKALQSHPGASDKMARNRTLVDFSYIPTDLIQGFSDKYL